MKMRIQLPRGLVVGLLMASSALGQGEPQALVSVQPPVDALYQTTVTGPPGALGAGFFAFKGADFLFEGKVVKGAPYAAQAVTDFTQVLSDGNRIVRKTTASLARDSEGRTRREQSFEAFGPWSSGEDTPQVVFINDPVAGVKYVLDAKSHRATKSSGSEGQVLTKMGGARIELRSNQIEKLKMEAISKEKRAEQQIESLGQQVIEGVQVEGKRTTSTIPAGQIGNEQPIKIVSETWYSPELQTVVMSRLSDPRMGETVYKLTNVDRAEPSPSLFDVPSDYTVIDEPQEARRMQEKMLKLKAAQEERK